MKQYLLAVHYVDGEPEPDAESMQQLGKDVDAVSDEMRERGAWVFGVGLDRPETATVVRDQDGQIVMTDGPFPEAKEQIAGFWIIKAKDRDEAHEWAAKACRACRGPIEVRPLDELDE